MLSNFLESFDISILSRLKERGTKEHEALLGHLALDSSHAAPLLSNQQHQNDHEMYNEYEQEEELFGGHNFEAIDTTLTNDEYVTLCVKRAQKFFYSESGNNEVKKQNLGDNKYTKIETAEILREYPQGAEADPAQMVHGNIKVIVPLARELLTPEPMPGNEQQLKYRRGRIEPLMEQRIFGILTKYQVGHIPNLEVCFNDVNDDGQPCYGMDTYAYMPLPAHQPLVVDVSKELYKHHELDDYIVTDFDKTDQTRN